MSPLRQKRGPGGRPQNEVIESSAVVDAIVKAIRAKRSKNVFTRAELQTAAERSQRREIPNTISVMHCTAASRRGRSSASNGGSTVPKRRGQELPRRVAGAETRRGGPRGPLPRLVETGQARRRLRLAGGTTRIAHEGTPPTGKVARSRVLDLTHWSLGERSNSPEPLEHRGSAAVPDPQSPRPLRRSQSHRGHRPGGSAFAPP